MLSPWRRPAPVWGPDHGRFLGELFPDETDIRAVLLDGQLGFPLRELTGSDLVEASAELFHAAFDNAPIGMAMFNTDSEYIRVNEALCQMLGRARRRHREPRR